MPGVESMAWIDISDPRHPLSDKLFIFLSPLSCPHPPFHPCPSPPLLTPAQAQQPTPHSPPPSQTSTHCTTSPPTPWAHTPRPAAAHTHTAPRRARPRSAPAAAGTAPQWCTNGCPWCTS